jgi:3-oxochol-4-en-24-oyl-CoA dehydrogenase
LPIAITDEQLALQASIRAWAKQAGTIELVRSAAPGCDPRTPAGLEPGAPGGGDGSEIWAGLAALGIFSIGVPARAGGAGGSTTDLAAALAQLTDSLVPGPVLPTLLAGLVLARHADQAAARAVLPQLVGGRASIATVLDAAFDRERADRDGLRVHGATGPVLGAGSTSHLLLGVSGGTGQNDAWCLVPSDHPGVTITSRSPADFSRSVADIRLDDVHVPADQVLTGVTADLVRDLAAMLFAVEAAAVAGWCSATAAEYAAIRQQFGRPIGSFQAVKHLCAGMACRAETASVLAWDAARAADEAQDELPLIAAAAAGFNLDAAVDNAKDCIQVLGGIGFSWEHDAHLYLRRALALRQLLGGSAAWRSRAGVLAMAGQRRSLTLTASSDGARLQAARAAARQFARATATLPESERRSVMADSGYAAPSWPAPYGMAASSAEQLVIDDELAAAGLARPDIGIGGWALPAILRHGDDGQRARFAGPTLHGEISWCQLFSEPEAGSDLASLRTRAERADGGWLITGQKVWTSLAREADWGICLARTDPAVPKHKGISFFLVAMGSPGIDVRPLREMTGRQMFNQVFLDQVFVPHDCLVGALGEGWRIARSTLASERLAIGTGSSVGAAVEAVLALAARTGKAAVVGNGGLDEANRLRALEQIGGLVAQGLAVSLLDLQAAFAQLRGADPGSLAAVRKLVGVGHRQAAAEAALELAAPGGAVADGEHAVLLEEFLLTRCLSIAGGTTQILLSLVAERLLGLPREEAR